MTDPVKIDTTYAELRDDDLLVAKDGARWHVSGVVKSTVKTARGDVVEFWLGDARTKVRAHHMTKPAGDPCTVLRTPTHADDVAALEAGSTLPDPSTAPHAPAGGALLTTNAAKGAATPGASTILAGGGSADPGASDPTSSPPAPAAGTPIPGLPGVASAEEDARRKAVLEQTFSADQRANIAANHAAAVAAVEQGMPGAAVEVDVTAAEVDAARKSTEDDPVVLPLFESMTDLEQRSHMFVLHGVFTDDVEDRPERQRLHVEAHKQTAAGKLRSRSTPHEHSAEVK